MTGAALSIAFGRVELLVARRLATGLAVEHRSAFRFQGELVRASFERVNRLNGRYLEIVRDVMRATVSAAGQARRAA